MESLKESLAVLDSLVDLRMSMTTTDGMYWVLNNLCVGWHVREL